MKRVSFFLLFLLLFFVPEPVLAHSAPDALMLNFDAAALTVVASPQPHLYIYTHIHTHTHTHTHIY